MSTLFTHGVSMEIMLIGKILGIAAYAALEYWLGKTPKVKAGSAIELVLDGVKYLAKGKSDGKAAN